MTSAVSNTCSLSVVASNWIPTLGTIAAVSTNTMDAVKQVGIPISSGSIGSHQEILGAWSGMGFAADYGSMGSLICTGGGHSDYLGNDVYRYDIASRAWSRIKDSASIFLASDTYIANPTTGWMWANTAATAVQVGQPFTSHFYGQLVVVPGAAMPGTAPNGWLFTPGRRSMPWDGQRSTAQAHALAIGSATLWEAVGVPMASEPAHSPSIYDSSRNRVIAFSNGPVSNYKYMSMATRTPGVQATTGGGIVAGFSVGGYSTTDDLYLIIGWSTSTLNVHHIVDPVTNIRYDVTNNVTGTPPPSTSTLGGWDWVNQWRTWVFYPGEGGKTVYTLKAPANPRNGTWTWGSQTLTGPTVPAQAGTPHYTRFKYIPAIERFLWVSTTTQAVQCFGVTQP